MMDVTEAKAEVIEDSIASQTGLDRWLAKVSESISAKADTYSVYEVTTDDAHRQADRDLKSMSADLKEIAAERMSITRVLDDAKRRVMDAEREATKALKEKHEALKAKDGEYKDSVVSRRMADLREAYEDAAPDIALPADEPLVSFEAIAETFGQGALGKKWTNFGTTFAQAEDQLMRALAKIADDEQTIEATVDESDVAEVKAVYFRSLDLSGALAEARSRKEERERLERLEEERRQREADRSEAEERQALRDAYEAKRAEITEHYADTLSQPSPGADVPQYVFMAYAANRPQLDGLIAYCKSRGIRGTAKPTRGNRYRLEVE